MSADPLAKEQLNRYNSLKAIREATFDSNWQSINDYFLPQQSNVNTEKTEGTTGWTDRIFDTTAIQAAQTLRSGQRNWLTPSSEPWAAFEPPEFLSVPGKEDQKDEVSQWLSRCADITMREFARSNFYSMINLDYLQLATTGTGCMFLEEGKKTALNFRQFKAWHITIEEDDAGIVDSVRRSFELTTRQAVQWFGIENVGEKIAKAYEKPAQHTRKWKFVHACFPREESKRVTGRMNGENKPWASVYINVDDIQTVQVSGYDEMPYLVSRFDKWGTDSSWGYSPAFLALPDARQINYVSQYRDALAELKAYPRLLYPDYLEGDVDLRAGGVTTFDPSIANGQPREWMTVGDDNSAEINMQRKADAINKAFYVNMFTMLEQLSDKKMTAYEIAQRIGEKLEQFTPVFDRRVTEFLNPLLARAFGILYRMGKFGPAPEALLVPTADGRSASLAMPEIAITSRISLALKALQNQGMVNTLSVIQPLAAERPDILDNIDMDKMVRELARNYGVPPDLLRPLKQVQATRQARAQQMAAQQALQITQGAAKAGKDLEKSPSELKEAVTSSLMGRSGQ